MYGCMWECMRVFVCGCVYDSVPMSVCAFCTIRGVGLASVSSESLQRHLVWVSHLKGRGVIFSSNER